MIRKTAALLLALIMMISALPVNVLGAEEAVYEFVYSSLDTLENWETTPGLYDAEIYFDLVKGTEPANAYKIRSASTARDTAFGVIDKYAIIEVIEKENSEGYTYNLKIRATASIGGRDVVSAIGKAVPLGNDEFDAEIIDPEEDIIVNTFISNAYEYVYYSIPFNSFDEDIYISYLSATNIEGFYKVKFYDGSVNDYSGRFTEGFKLPAPKAEITMGYVEAYDACNPNGNSIRLSVSSDMTASETQKIIYLAALDKNFDWNDWENWSDWKYTSYTAANFNFTVQYSDLSSATVLVLDREPVFTRDETIYIRSGAVVNDGKGNQSVVYSDIEEITLSVLPYGVTELHNNELGITIGADAYNIPYYAQMKLSYDVSRTNEVIASMVKAQTGAEIENFVVFDFDLTDSNTNSSIGGIKGNWSGTVFRPNYFQVTQEVVGQGFIMGNMKGYKITAEGTVIEMAGQYGPGYAIGQGKMKFQTNDDGSFAGTYVMVNGYYSDLDEVYISDSYTENETVQYNYTPVSDGYYKIPAYLEGSLDYKDYIDGRALLELAGVAPGVSVNEIETAAKLQALKDAYSNGKAYLYVSFVPNGHDYISSVKIKGTEAEWIERYTIEGTAYPKTIKIDTAMAAFTEAEIRFSNGRAETAKFSFDYWNRWDFTALKAAAPTVTTNTGAYNFINGSEAEITLATPSVGGRIFYSIEYKLMDENGITSEIQQTVSNEEYTGPIILKSAELTEELYKISAYTVKNGVMDSEIYERTIRFRAENAYANDVNTPVIKARYAEGTEEANGKYTVEIISDTPAAADGVKIYYTTDGTAPSQESTLYTGKFETPVLDLKGSPVKIMAIGYADGHNTSEAAEYTINFSNNWWDSLLEGDQFEISVEMRKWGDDDSYSMGNQALTGTADLMRKNGKVYANIYFQEIDMGGIMGHLINMWYFENQSVMENGAAVRRALNSIMPSWELEYSSIYIAAIELLGSKGTYTKGGDNYLSHVTIPVFDERDSNIIMLESDFQAMGKQFANLVFDYSGAYKEITGKEMEKDIRLPAPSIDVSLNSGGNRLLINLSVPAMAEVTEADIYYMFSGSDDVVFIKENERLYTGPVTLTLEEMLTYGGEDGTFNIFALTSKDGFEDSIINMRKIAVETGNSNENGENNGSGGNGNNSENEKDGKYTVDIYLYKESLDEISMGDGAFKNNRKALIESRDGVNTIQIASNPVKIDPYYSGLEDLRYRNARGIFQSVIPIQTGEIETIYEGREYTFDYLQVFEFKLPIDLEEADYIDVKIKVPYTVMDTAVKEGYIDARLKLDWDTLAKTGDGMTLTADSSTASGEIAVEGPELNKEDEKTGIRLEAGENIFPQGSELRVSVINAKTDGELYSEVVETIGFGYEVLNIFDIAVILDKDIQAPGKNVTIYFPIEDDFDLNRVQIFRINPVEDGEGNYYTKTLLEYVIWEDGRYIAVTTGAMGIFAMVYSEEEFNVRAEDFISDFITDKVIERGFTDIKGHWAEESINTVVELGLFSGVSDRDFEPDKVVERGMFTEVLGRLAGISQGHYKTWQYSDVQEGDYFATSVAWATLMGITKGMETGYFGADTAISREQTAVMLVRFALVYGIDISSENKGIIFTDADEMSLWAADSIQILAQDGVINGRPDGTFDPKGTATRAESAVMLDNFIREYMPEKLNTASSTENETEPEEEINN